MAVDRWKACLAIYIKSKAIFHGLQNILKDYFFRIFFTSDSLHPNKNKNTQEELHTQKYFGLYTLKIRQNLIVKSTRGDTSLKVFPLSILFNHKKKISNGY